MAKGIQNMAGDTTYGSPLAIFCIPTHFVGDTLSGATPDKIFKLKVTTTRSKVKSRSDHNVAHLHILSNVPTKYQLPTSYSF